MNNKANTKTPKPDGKPALSPKLRFPEFRDAEGWEQTQLQKIARPVSDRAVTGDGDNVLSLSGEHGLVLQSDYFGKKVAGDSAERYLKLVRNDFVYNDRTTKASVYGTIKRLSKYDGGIVSPIYKCFRFHSDENPVFWEWYFESGSHEAQLGSLVNEGARAGRFNISISQFLSTSAWRAEEPEQQKIAECLSSVDELMVAQARKLVALKTHKKGLMQQIFPREGETQPRLRFPEFQNAGVWMEWRFGDLLDDIIDFRGRTPTKLGMAWGGGNITTLSANNVKNGFVDYNAECNLGSEELYSRWMGDVNLEKEDIIFTMEAPLGNALLLPDSRKYILSQRVVAFKTKAEVLNPFLVQIIWGEGFQNEISKLATGSTAKGINQKALKTVPVRLPDADEQQRIASCLTSLDDLIAAQAQKLDALKTHKKGLMQQLFPAPEAVEA